MIFLFGLFDFILNFWLLWISVLIDVSIVVVFDNVVLVFGLVVFLSNLDIVKLCLDMVIFKFFVIVKILLWVILCKNVLLSVFVMILLLLIRIKFVVLVFWILLFG